MKKMVVVLIAFFSFQHTYTADFSGMTDQQVMQECQEKFNKFLAEFKNKKGDVNKEDARSYQNYMDKAKQRFKEGSNEKNHIVDFTILSGYIVGPKSAHTQNIAKYIKMIPGNPELYNEFFIYGFVSKNLRNAILLRLFNEKNYSEMNRLINDYWGPNFPVDQQYVQAAKQSKTGSPTTATTYQPKPVEKKKDPWEREKNKKYGGSKMDYNQFQKQKIGNDSADNPPKSISVYRSTGNIEKPKTVGSTEEEREKKRKEVREKSEHRWQPLASFKDAKKSVVSIDTLFRTLEDLKQQLEHLVDTLPLLNKEG